MASEQPDLGGQLDAMWREGLKDLHNAIVPAFPESQRGVDEIGTPLSPTQMMVNDDLGREYGQESDRGYEKMLEEYSQQAQEMGQERGMERE